MKRILCAFALILFFATQAMAIEIDLTKEGKVRELLTLTGTKLLNANKIDKRVVFECKKRQTINAYAIIAGGPRTVVVYNGLIPYIDNDDELAAILGHEIAHSVDSYNGFFRGSLVWVSYAFAPRKYEYMADKRAIDYMVNAGYNPLGFITIMNKISGQYRFELFSSHPLTSKRLVTAYEYIYRKYPTFLANNTYKDNIYYQNFLLTSTKNRTLLQDNLKMNSKAKVRYK